MIFEYQIRENMNITEEIIWDYADGFLAPREYRELEDQLKLQPEWQARLELILAEKRAFKASTLENPGEGFASQVMTAWATEQVALSKKPVVAKPDWVLRGIAGVISAVMIWVFVLMLGAAPETGLFNIAESYMPELPSIDWGSITDSIFIRYSMILLLAWLTLQILDKYLQQQNLYRRWMPGH